MAGEGFNDPNTTHEIFSSRIKVPATEYIGHQGRIFYHESTGELRISDGVTPHGHPIFVHTTGSGNITLSLYASSGDAVLIPLALGDKSTALGDGAKTYAAGALNQSAGSFTSHGDAQTGNYIFRNITTNNTLTELYLDGTMARYITPSNSTVSFTINVTARRTDSGNEGGIYEVKGGIDKGNFNSSTRLIGRINKTIVSEDTPAWDFTVSADTTTGALKLWAKGENGKTIRWVAHLQTVEVHN